MFQGLYYCNFSQSNPIEAQKTFCIVKITQVVATSIILVFVFYEILQILKKNNYHLKPSLFNFISIVCLMMLISLIFNITFSFLHQDYIFLYLQTLFYNLYFLVVFSYVGYNIATKGLPRIVIHIIVLVFAITFVGIFIRRVVTQLQSCKQIWFLVVDSLGIILSVILFAIFLYKQQKQSKRQRQRQNFLRIQAQKADASQKLSLIQKNNSYPNYKKQLIESNKFEMPNASNFKQDSSFIQIKYNPFPSMWIMILANIIAQVASLMEAVMFQIIDKDEESEQNQNSCNLQKQQTSALVIIQFLFVIFGYYLGFLASLYTFNRKRNNKQKILNQVKKNYNSYYQNNQNTKIVIQKSKVVYSPNQSSHKNNQLSNTKSISTNRNNVSLKEELSLEYQI